MKIYVKCRHNRLFNGRPFDCRFYKVSDKGCKLFWEYLMLEPSANTFIKEKINKVISTLTETQQTFGDIVVDGDYFAHEVRFSLEFYTLEGSCTSFEMHPLSLVDFNRPADVSKKGEYLKEYLNHEQGKHDFNNIISLGSICSGFLFMVLWAFKDIFLTPSSALIGLGCVFGIFIITLIYKCFKSRNKKDYWIFSLNADDFICAYSNKLIIEQDESIVESKNLKYRHEE